MRKGTGQIFIIYSFKIYTSNTLQKRCFQAEKEHTRQTKYLRVNLDVILECVVLMTDYLCWHKRDCIIGRYFRRVFPLYTCPANSWLSSHFWFRMPATGKIKSWGVHFQGESQQTARRIMHSLQIFPHCHSSYFGIKKDPTFSSQCLVL